MLLVGRMRPMHPMRPIHREALMAAQHTIMAVSSKRAPWARVVGEQPLHVMVHAYILFFDLDCSGVLKDVT